MTGVMNAVPLAAFSLLMLFALAAPVVLGLLPEGGPHIVRVYGPAGPHGSFPKDSVPLLRHDTRRVRTGVQTEPRRTSHLETPAAEEAATAALAAANYDTPLWRRRAEFFVPLLVGTPPRRVWAQIDTGSSVSVIVGAPCLAQPNPEQRCTGYFDTPFNASLSTTARPAVFNDKSDGGNRVVAAPAGERQQPAPTARTPNASTASSGGSYFASLGGDWGGGCSGRGDVVARFADGSEVSGCYVEDWAAIAPPTTTDAQPQPSKDSLRPSPPPPALRPFAFLYVVASTPQAQRSLADVGPLLGLAPPPAAASSSSSQRPLRSSLTALVGTASFALDVRGPGRAMLRFGSPAVAFVDARTGSLVGDAAQFIPLATPSPAEATPERRRATRARNATAMGKHGRGGLAAAVAAAVVAAGSSHGEGLRVRASGGAFVGRFRIATDGGLGPAVIDSGSLFVSLPPCVFAAFRLALRGTPGLCYEGSPLCASVDALFAVGPSGEGTVPLRLHAALAAAMPAVDVEFGAFRVAVPPDAYLLPRPCSADAVRTAVAARHAAADEAKKRGATDNRLADASASSPGAASATSFAATAEDNSCVVVAIDGNGGGAVEDAEEDTSLPKLPFTVLGLPFLRSVAIAFDEDKWRLGFFPTAPRRQRSPPDAVADLTTAVGRAAAGIPLDNADGGGNTGGDEEALAAVAIVVTSSGMLVVASVLLASLTAFFVIRKTRFALASRRPAFGRL